MSLGGVRVAAAYRLACAGVLVAVVGVYANHFPGEFHFDDSHTIVNNAYVRDLSNIPRFFRDPSTFSSLPANQGYRPLLTTTFAVDYWLADGLRPGVFHATSLALFLAQCAVLLVLFRRVMDHALPSAANRWVALAATSWYAVHTANAETVNYLSARSEILSTLGVVSALVLFASGGRLRRWGVYLLPAAASVLAKEQGAMYAPLLFVYVALVERDMSMRGLLEPRRVFAVLSATWPAFVVCALVLAAGLTLATSFVPGGASWTAYLLTQPFVIVHYLLAFALPVNLSADTDWTVIANPFDDRVLVGAAAIAAMLAIAARASARRETRPVAFGLLWFFIALLPTSSVIPLAEVTNDHRMYFPFVGLTLAATWAGWLVYRRHATAPSPRTRVALAAPFGIVLLALAYGTYQRNEVWASAETLWRDVTRKSPSNGRGLMTYGVIRMGKGDLAEAERYFLRALQLVPRYAYLHVNLGVLRGAQHRDADAERHFRLAQEYAPGDPVSLYYYARWLGSRGRHAEAIALARRAVELSPAHADARALLASLDASRPPSDPPVLAPESPESWLTLSLAQYQAADYTGCIESSRQALRLRPDYAEAHNNICAAENALGRHAAAAAACERALALKPDFALARNNLAVARSRLTGAPTTRSAP